MNFGQSVGEVGGQDLRDAGWKVCRSLYRHQFAKLTIVFDGYVGSIPALSANGIVAQQEERQLEKLDEWVRVLPLPQLSIRVPFR